MQAEKIVEPAWFAKVGVEFALEKFLLVDDRPPCIDIPDGLEVTGYEQRVRARIFFIGFRGLLAPTMAELERKALLHMIHDAHAGDRAACQFTNERQCGSPSP